jgi:hypothetical protein
MKTVVTNYLCENLRSSLYSAYVIHLHYKTYTEHPEMEYTRIVGVEPICRLWQLWQSESCIEGS